MEIVTLNGENLTIEDIINVAYNDYAVHITEEVREKINDSRKVIDGIVSRNDVKYGITTGFG
ncbi:MAG TPA: histidine ammonia-lyase, partial [Clostridium sp.]|nr:histidine ammonia-lyase [Clostridium sp.]